MKKTLIWLLLAAFLLPSCSQNTPGNTDTSAPDSTTPQVTEATAGRAEIEEEGELWFADNDGEVILFEA